jgi:MFS family permease
LRWRSASAAARRCRFGSGLQTAHGCLDRGQAGLAARQLSGQIITAPAAQGCIVLGILLMRLGHQGFNVFAHTVDFLVQIGVSEQTAAWLFGLQLFVTVPLYLVLGWAADRFPKPSVLMWASLAGTASFALLASPYHGRGLLLAFVVLFAICDASAPTNWAVVGEYFGRKTFSRLQGYIQFANFPGVLSAPVFLGWWYDHHHSYAVPLWLYTGVSLVGALTFAVLKRPPSATSALDGAPSTPPATAAGSPQPSD